MRMSEVRVMKRGNADHVLCNRSRNDADARNARMDDGR